jgi:hypothetical protein
MLALSISFEHMWLSYVNQELKLGRELKEQFHVLLNRVKRELEGTSSLEQIAKHLSEERNVLVNIAVELAKVKGIEISASNNEALSIFDGWNPEEKYDVIQENGMFAIRVVLKAMQPIRALNFENKENMISSLEERVNQDLQIPERIKLMLEVLSVFDKVDFALLVAVMVKDFNLSLSEDRIEELSELLTGSALDLSLLLDDLFPKRVDSKAPQTNDEDYSEDYAQAQQEFAEIGMDLYFEQLQKEC